MKSFITKLTSDTNISTSSVNDDHISNDDISYDNTNDITQMDLVNDTNISYDNTNDTSIISLSFNDNDISYDNNDISYDNNKYDGGLIMSTKKKPIILYIDYFKEQTQRILKHLSNNGIPVLDITEQLNNELLSGNIYNTVLTDNTDRLKALENIRTNNDFSFIKAYLDKITSNYKVISYNISAYLNIDMFSDFKRYYYKGDMILLSYFNQFNESFYESLMLVNEIYNLRKEETKNSALEKINKDNALEEILIMYRDQFNFKTRERLAYYYMFTNNKRYFNELLINYGVKLLDSIKLEKYNEKANYLPLDNEYTQMALTILIKDISE